MHLHTTPELRDTAVTRESRLTPHVKPTWSEKSSPEIVELGNKPTWEKQLSLRRGEEYPAYQKENVKEHYGLASPNAERMERPHSSYSLQTSSIKGTFPQKTVWDGTIAGFQTYKLSVEGFYRQQGAGYLFDKEFQRLYQLVGPSEVVDHPDLPKYIKISRPQLDEAKRHLYGAIQTSTRRTNLVRKYLNRHLRESDGIMVWIEFSRTQDNEGNVEVRKDKLLSITTQLYTKGYPGGLVRYISDIQDAYEGLEVLGWQIFDDHKRQQLLNNLTTSGVNDYYVCYCRDNFKTFDGCLEYLRKEAVRRDHFHHKVGSRKANLAILDEPTTEASKQDDSGQGEPTMDYVLGYCEALEMESSPQNIRTVNQAMMRNPDYFIPKPVFDLMRSYMTTEQFKEFLAKKMTAEQNSTRKPAVPKTVEAIRPNENTPPIAPRQYQKTAQANLTVQEYYSSDDESEDSFPGDELQQAREAMAEMSELYRSANVVRRAYLGTTNMINTTKYRRLIFDTGADTCVVGKGWDVTHVYGLPISLVGFDSTHARKKDLRICTAQTIIEHPEAGRFLIRVHQAVHNPDAEDSLMSEYQLSEAGCKVDSKPTFHKYPNGEKGSQSLLLPNREEIFRLNIDACLMTYPHRLPTSKDLAELDPIDITSLAAWEPSDYTVKNPGFNVQQEIMTCKAMMLQEDQSRTLWFDCLADDHHGEYYFDPMPEHQRYGFKSQQTLNKDSISLATQDPFLQSVSEIELPPEDDPYDVVSYMKHAMSVTKHVKPRITKKNPIDPANIQRCLAFLPLEQIKKTLECTTQLVHWTIKVPMQQHWKARFPFMNVHRLREAVATDTFFANCKALGGILVHRSSLGSKVK